MKGPRRAAVLGSPVAHSLSPALHTAAYRALGLDGWHYEAVEVDVAGLPGFLDGVDGTWAGLSLTMPLKQAVLPLLARADPLVTGTGSCNTVVLPGRNGHNTDVAGIVAALADVSPHPPAGPAVVLGAGATAASALAALARLGITDAILAARSPARARAAADAGAVHGVEVDLVPLDDPTLPGLLAAAPAAVSTLPAGAADPAAASLPSRVTGILLDVVYEPWPTALAAAWRRARGEVVAGEEMLLHQAAAQVALMTGLEAPVDAMRAGMAAERTRRRTGAGLTARS